MVIKMIIAYIAAGVLLLFAVLRLFSLRGKKKNFGSLLDYHYAHRGLHGHGVPENCLMGFRLAVEKGYGAELDVHLSKDGKLVVIHDENLKRTAGIDKKVCDCTWEELKNCTLEGTSEPIPQLREVLELFAGKTPLIIELKAHKGNHKELACKVCELVDEYPELSYCIESFDPRVLLWLRKNRPEIIRGQLSCDLCKEPGGPPWILAWLLKHLFFNFLTLPHFIAYRFEDRNILALKLCKKLWGVQEIYWTLRSRRDGEQAMREHCPIIFEHYCPETRKSNVR